MRCKNHPNVEATHTAEMPSPVKQLDGRYGEDVPLCTPCAEGIGRLSSWPVTRLVEEE